MNPQDPILSSLNLRNIGAVHAHELQPEKIKIENLIGFARVPLGVAGPLTILGQSQSRTVMAPLATVEPTLVASCSRGCKAFQQHGGIHAIALAEGMSRAPVFRFNSVGEAVAFYQQLLRITPHIIGASVHAKFDYTCGDAAGQNMVTIATSAACEAFLASSRAQELGVVGFQLEGQLASDKKASWGNVKDPRGAQVLSWGTIIDETSRSILGVGVGQLHQILTTTEQGAIRNGQFGSNVNTANVLAAMFTACGQDAASVLEAGWSHLTSELDVSGQKLTLSLFMPSLPVGTVGGGTMYATQREALEMLGCYGEGKKWRLADTICAFALALDVSTISAIVNDTFAASHKRLARL